MSQSSAAPLSGSPAVEIPTVPLAQLAPWALFAALIGSVVVYFAGADAALHEWVHDARHLLGYPCH
ncbi:CbtB domain-containing protein [Nocardioides panacisoli]|uniref:CbtB-domain containing protein n=1 Tax=Nocardioides panacisoli TaxID=627624 RepID=A0ABP7INJ0_9ACTN